MEFDNRPALERETKLLENLSYEREREREHQQQQPAAAAIKQATYFRAFFLYIFFSLRNPNLVEGMPNNVQRTLYRI